MTRPLVLPDHNLEAEVYAVLPVAGAIELAAVAFRVWYRFNYAAQEEDTLPSEMAGAVADRLRRLVAKGKAEKVGDGWRRATANPAAPNRTTSR